MEDLEFVKLILDIVPKSMRAIRLQMRGAARASLTVPQFRVFNRLSKSPATNRELADWMGVSAPTMTRMVDGLVRRRLVKRVVEKGDRRRVNLQLTASGQLKFNEIAGVVRAKFATTISHLRESEKQDLAAGLAVLGELFQ